jgi:ketosteroid isomerase-like protein
MRSGAESVAVAAVAAVVAATLILNASAAVAQDPTAAAEQAFEAAYAEFSAAYRAGDPAAVTALYAANAFYLSPGKEIDRGNVEGHFEWLSSFDPGAGPVIEFEIVDREISGELGYDIGYYTIRQPEAEPGSGSRGKFIVIWKRGEDGVWRIHADAFSAVNESGTPVEEGK